MELFVYEKEHIKAVRDSLAECTLFLKRDGAFPLSAPCSVAAYGGGVRNTVKGGTGSGEVNSRYSVNIEQGLKDAGFTVTTEAWMNAFDKVHAQAQDQFKVDIVKEAESQGADVFMYVMGKNMPEPEYDIPLTADDGCLSDAAIYVVSRISGEASDRRLQGGDVFLTDSEVRDILALNAQYEKFMLVLNVGGVVDLTPVNEVRNILLLSQLGIETGVALADILLGKANPSGKLTTTWAAFENYPPMEDFDDLNDTRYREGIYVGYRYFDTFDKPVLYPFGYGLSYTDFSHTILNVTGEGELITASVTVTNIGSMAGKEVIQAYLSAPQGRLGKPSKDLCAFAKTPQLAPGESCRLTLTFKMSDMASYDVSRAAYVLEAGEYILLIGNSCTSSLPAALIRLDEEIVTAEVKNIFGETDFDDLRPNDVPKYELPDSIPTIRVSAADISRYTPVYDTEPEILPEVDTLTADELILMNIGAFDPDATGLAAIIGNAASSVCGAAGETTARVRDYPTLVMADGPAGLRLEKEYYLDESGKPQAFGAAGVPESMQSGTDSAEIAARKSEKEVLYQYCTAIPIGSAIAQSFNCPLAECYGDIVGNEMERFGVQLWLAPAMNIHRSIRCGRNFEYYSEDPLVAGKMASAITRGVQTHPGCGTTIKHYAANNKEENRYGSNSMVSERAMREIYVKGFGICVRESQPKALMTSYNLINGIHTAEHRGMIEDLLRAEFGFKGIVMTDWVISIAADKRGTHRNTLAHYTAAAGSNLFMPGGKGDFANMKQALEDGTLTEHQLKINASRTLSMIRELRR